MDTKTAEFEKEVKIETQSFSVASWTCPVCMRRHERKDIRQVGERLQGMCWECKTKIVKDEKTGEWETSNHIIRKAGIGMTGFQEVLEGDKRPPIKVTVTEDINLSVSPYHCVLGHFNPNYIPLSGKGPYVIYCSLCGIQAYQTKDGSWISDMRDRK